MTTYDPEMNFMYYEQKCNIYGCDYGENPDPDDTCQYCFGPQPTKETPQ